MRLLPHLVFGQGLPVKLYAMTGPVRSNGFAIFDLQRIFDKPLEPKPVYFQVYSVGHSRQQMKMYKTAEQM